MLPAFRAQVSAPVKLSARHTGAAHLDGSRQGDGVQKRRCVVVLMITVDLLNIVRLGVTCRAGHDTHTSCASGQASFAYACEKPEGLQVLMWLSMMPPQGMVGCLTPIMQDWQETGTVMPGNLAQRHNQWTYRCLTKLMQEWLKAVHRGTPQASRIILLASAYLVAQTAAQ